jgi:hypothetical protein
LRKRYFPKVEQSISFKNQLTFQQKIFYHADVKKNFF